MAAVLFELRPINDDYIKRIVNGDDNENLSLTSENHFRSTKTEL